MSSPIAFLKSLEIWNSVVCFRQFVATQLLNPSGTVSWLDREQTAGYNSVASFLPPLDIIWGSWFVTVEGANVPQSRMPWAACLWPGLPQLWFRGAWFGLIVAAGFAVVVNGLLAATFVWTAWLDPRLRTAGWIGLGAVWLLALVVARWDLGIDWAVGRRWSRLRRRAGLPDGYCEGMSTDDLYREAQTQYLRGNYLQAETMLCHLTDRLGGDVDAQLMLATLYRHTGRLEEAAERLRRLELLEDAGKWQQEIQGEWASLRRVREESAVVESDGVTAAASVARP